jgi:hypothetical protein
VRPPLLLLNSAGSSGSGGLSSILYQSLALGLLTRGLLSRAGAAAIVAPPVRVAPLVQGAAEAGAAHGGGAAAAAGGSDGNDARIHVSGRCPTMSWQ